MKNKINYILLAVIIFSAIIRLIYLNILPTGVTNDELHFILNAKSVFYKFSDLSNQWNPISLKTIPGESSSELPFIILSPILGPLPTNLFTARLPFVFFSLGTTILIYLIVNRLFNQKLGLMAALIYSINPWSIYVSRTSFDAPIANFFYILTLYLFLKLKNNKIILIFIPAFFAFYTYIGSKILLIPFVIICSIFSYIYINNHRYLRQYLIVIFATILLTIYYAYGLINQASGARISELTNPNNQQIIDQVEIERNQTIDTPITKIFSNRYVYYLNKFTKKYLNSYSPNVLFLEGDPTYLVSLWKHGYFYIIDFCLIILGFCYVFSKSKPIFLLITAIILIAPIPEAIRVDNIPAYAFHSSLQFPFLSIICSLGILSFNNIFKNRLLLIFIYTISFINFVNIYFFQYPIYQSEGFSFSRQILSNYLIKIPQNKTVTVLTNEPESLYRNYLFYSNKFQQNKPGVFKVDRINFTNKFDESTKNDVLISMTEIVPVAFNGEKSIKIHNISNNLPIYSIYNDSLCPSLPMVNKSEKIKFSDLNLSSISTERFCNLYIK